MKKNEVDIIVPIYHTSQCTKKCLKSIIENTNLYENNLILINNMNSDNDFSNLLSELGINNTLNIEVIKNSSNISFAKTANIGINNSNNDVILLNSDVEVTKCWLEKLKKCAYSRKFVASVTPLWNNKSMPLLNNISLKEYAKDIEECSFRAYPDIPDGHNFCMYITREAINKVGLFDDINFDTGYGAERDFSFRALKQGFVNLLCDDTYIYYNEDNLFLKENKEFITNNTMKLEQKYPEYCYIEYDYAIQYIQDNIKYYINNKYRKNLLFIIHDFKTEDAMLLGGTTLHTYDLIKNIRDKMNVHVLYPEGNAIKIKSFFENSIVTVNLATINAYNKINFYNNEYKEALKMAFGLIKIDLIHIHHLYNHYLDIFDIAKKYNIPTILTIHDFYTICPTTQLVSTKHELCLDGKKDYCEICLNQVYGLEGNIMQVWKEQFYERLLAIDKIIAPSYSAKSIMLKEYPKLDIEIIEHGIERVKVKKDLKPNNKYNIAFIGGIHINKGLHILNDLVTLINQYDEETVTIHLFGTTFMPELNVSNKNYIYHGLYNRADLYELLIKNDIKLVCLLSICPETYSYTLTETINAEIPVLTFNVGATFERVKSNEAGWIIDIKSDAKAIYNKILDIKNNTEEYKEKLEATLKYKNKLKTVEEMSKEYVELYESYIKNKSAVSQVFDKKYIKLLLYNNQQIMANMKKSEVKIIEDLKNEIIIDKIKFKEEIRKEIKSEILNKFYKFRIIKIIKKNKLLCKIFKKIYNYILGD